MRDVILYLELLRLQAVAVGALKLVNLAVVVALAAALAEIQEQAQVSVV